MKIVVYQKGWIFTLLSQDEVTLRCWPKSTLEPTKRDGVLYRIPRECGKVYICIGEKGRAVGERIINNYWMRLNMISWIMKTEGCVICRSRRLRQITQTRGFDDSWYHPKTEFNNCFITHFSHHSSSETKAKHSALTSGRRHSTLNKRTPLNKAIVFIVFLVLLSSIVVRQLCLLHEVRAKRSAISFWGGHSKGLSNQATIVRKADSAIHRINHYPADSVVCFVDTYPLDSDLSGG